MLEEAGYQVVVSLKHLCCGRPLYDYGFLDLADRYLHAITTGIQPYLEKGTPIVVLEPSCLAVFRDEVKDLLPHDHNAQRLSKQSFTLAEFLETQTPRYTPRGLNRKVVVHGHCHQKAIMGMSHEASLLKKMGADMELLDSGCCGMAGSFGFEKNKYQVSQTVFKHELQTHIETASQETILIADGFSCKTQIKQNSGREALHIAQVMKLALDQGQLANPGRTAPK